MCRVPVSAVLYGGFGGVLRGHFVLENSALKLKEDQALYRDQAAADGHYKPVAFQAEHSFFVEAGKLHYEYNGESFDVDPISLHRRHTSADRFPPFRSVEW